jgi:hypothetical protein
MLTARGSQTLDIDELSWNEARLLLLPLAPDLVKIIDQLAPSAAHKLYRARYPFGAKIIDKKNCYLPLKNGETIHFNDHSLPSNIIKNLSYDPLTSNPVGIVLNKQSEFYLSTNNRMMPYAMVSPGDIFGLARILDNAEASHTGDLSHRSFFMWEMTSGSRSLFMLPKITENISHTRLNKRYNLSLTKPEGCETHWDIFKAITAREQSSWQSEFLYFSNNWFTKLTDPAWSNFYNYCLRKNRLSYGYWRNILSWQVTFNVIEQAKNLRFSSYTLDTAKHLFAVAAGSLPGFKPATNEMAAPIHLLQEAYVDGYGLTEYWPVLMELGSFALDSSAPVYYSLNYPTLAQSDPSAFKGTSLITLLDELQLVMEKYQKGIRNDSLAMASSLYDTAQQVAFSYYHNDPGGFPNIRDNTVLPAEDPRFIIPHASGEFPKHSSFLKGCIKIATKPEAI